MEPASEAVYTNGETPPLKKPLESTVLAVERAKVIGVMPAVREFDITASTVYNNGYSHRIKIPDQ